jgi:nicotinic acid mononucleotide adenylyltransferase
MTKVLLARTDDQLFTPEERISIVEAITRHMDIGLAFANRGTYIDVGRALKATGVDASFIVGADKLVQLEDPAFYPDGARGVDATFDELRFIVIPRTGSPIVRHDVVVVDTADVFEDETTAGLSASRVRADVRMGIDVEHLVPPEVAVALGGYTSAR